MSDEHDAKLEAVVSKLSALYHEVLAIQNAPWYVKLWWRIQDLLKAKGSGDE